MGVERLISGLAASLSLMLAAAPVLAQTAPASEFDQGGKICIGSHGQVNAEPLPDWIGPALAAMDQTPSEMTFSFRQVGADRVLYATGEIDENAAAHLQAALDRFGPINEIHFNSPGGDSAQGEAIGHVIRKHGKVTTRVVQGNGCASACSTAFLGGFFRQIDPGALYGIHLFSRAFDKDMVVKPEEWSIITQIEAKLIGGRAVYISKMGISTDWLNEWINTHPDCMLFFSQELLKKSFVDNF